MIFLCFLFSSFVSFTQYSSLDRKRSLRRQRVFTYSPLKFVVETFLFPRSRVFSSRPIKSLIVTPLLAIALAGIRIGRILREKEDSHPLLTARKVSPDWSQKTITCHSFNCFSIVWGHHWWLLFRAAATCRSVSDSLGCLDPAVLPTRQLLNSRLMTHRIQIKSRLIFNSISSSAREGTRESAVHAWNQPSGGGVPRAQAGDWA